MNLVQSLHSVEVQYLHFIEGQILHSGNPKGIACTKASVQYMHSATLFYRTDQTTKEQKFR